LFHDLLAQQIQAFQTAILDDCQRAVRAGQSDAMALKLRANALALYRAQAAMLAMAGPGLAPAATDKLQETADDDPTFAAGDVHPGEPGGERSLAGDALSRFVSRRLDPSESAHDAWHRSLTEAPATPRQRNPALPRPGFRRPDG
jgi:hypothetical protein